MIEVEAKLKVALQTVVMALGNIHFSKSFLSLLMSLVQSKFSL